MSRRKGMPLLWPEVFWNDQKDWGGGDLTRKVFKSHDYEGRVTCVGIISEQYTILRTYVANDTPKEEQERILQIMEDVIRAKGVSNN